MNHHNPFTKLRDKLNALTARVAALEAHSAADAASAPMPLPEPESPAPPPVVGARPAPVDAVAWLRARAKTWRCLAAKASDNEDEDRRLDYAQLFEFAAQDLEAGIRP